MFAYTPSSPPKEVCQVWMANSNVLSQKVEKAVAKLESDRL